MSEFDFKIYNKEEEQSKKEEQFAKSYIWGKLISLLLALPIFMIFGIIYEILKRTNFKINMSILYWAGFACMCFWQVIFYSLYWDRRCIEKSLWKNINYTCTFLIIVFVLWHFICGLYMY